MNSKILDYIYQDKKWQNDIIKIDYSLYAINQSNILYKNWINDTAIKRKYEEWITIDSKESLDLDDWIWAERMNNWYAVFVHISDVSEAIDIFSPLDLEAFKRTTSIYRSEILNMFPNKLSQDLLSLNENCERLTLTAKIELNNSWEIENIDVYESIFKNLKRYDYESFKDDFMNPDSSFHTTLQLMYEIALKRKTNRLLSWAIIDYDESDRKLSIPNKNNISSSSIHSIIIQEFMILANICASKIAFNNKYNFIFRVHKSLEERAFYDNKSSYHRWLALDSYTHFTSPIRRYADLIVHRVLKIVHIRWEKNPYSKEEIKDIVNHINLTRSVIDIVWKDIDFEISWKKLVDNLKKKNKNINTSCFTWKIRHTVGNNKKLPKAVVDEIIKDIRYQNKWNWAWAIWVFLISDNKEIKNEIKNAILERNIFSPKSIFSILNCTKIMTWDNEYLFKINEIKEWNSFKIEVYFKWDLLFKNSINFWKINKKKAIWIIRHKVLKRLIKHFV